MQILKETEEYRITSEPSETEIIVPSKYRFIVMIWMIISGLGFGHLCMLNAFSPKWPFIQIIFAISLACSMLCHIVSISRYSVRKVPSLKITLQEKLLEYNIYSPSCPIPIAINLQKAKNQLAPDKWQQVELIKDVEVMSDRVNEAMNYLIQCRNERLKEERMNRDAANTKQSCIEGIEEAVAERVRR